MAGIPIAMIEVKWDDAQNKVRICIGADEADLLTVAWRLLVGSGLLGSIPVMGTNKRTNMNL